MRIACLGGGPAGLYFAIAMKRRDPGHEIVVVERNRPDDTFGWGVVLSDETLANLAASRSRQRRRRSAARSSTGTTSPSSTAARSRARRATASAASAASGCSTSCRTGRGRSASSCASRPRSTALEPYRGYDLDRRRRRRQLEGARRPGARLQAGHRRARLQVHLARHARTSSTTPSRSSSRRPSTAGSGRTPTSSTPTPRPSSSSARRRPGAGSASTRMSQEETIAACERIFAGHLGGHRLMTNARHLRGSAWLNFNRVLCETLVAREHRADGRRGGHRAFLGRLGHQARAGERHRARRVPAQRADHGRRPSAATRTSAAPRCCGCRARRATRPSGSSTSSATCISIRCSSTIRC